MRYGCCGALVLLLVEVDELVFPVVLDELSCIFPVLVSEVL